MSDSAEVTIKEAPTGAEAPVEVKPYTGPEYIPEQFRTAEDPAKALAESYAELRKKLSEPKPDAATAGETPEQKAAREAAETPEAKATREAAEAAAAAAAPAETFKPFFAEFETTGALSEDSYAKLEKIGLSKDMVDTYIEGQLAIANVTATQLKNSVGGEAVYDAMIAWGVQGGLSAEEQAAYETVLATGNMTAAQTAAAGLVAKFQAATGSDPARQVTGNAGGGTGGAYQSHAEMMRDMAKPEYATDPAFQAEVLRKAKNSTAF